MDRIIGLDLAGLLSVYIFVRLGYVSENIYQTGLPLLKTGRPMRR
jgi:hypothetical protein